MSFDDYSYKYFNEIILNPNALLAINEYFEDQDSIDNKIEKTK